MTPRLLFVSGLVLGCALVGCDCGCVDAPVAATTPAATNIEPVTLTWEVQGMHCGGCANAIKSKIAALSGVSSCDVSFDDSQAVVVADPARSVAIEGIMASLGYTFTAQ